MKTIRIYDLIDATLNFDLPQILAMLNPLKPDALWQVRSVEDGDYRYFDAHGSGAEQLEALEQSGDLTSGKMLAEMAKDLDQVIWGQFVAQSGEVQWLVLRAIDSTFFEITTADERVLRLMSDRFEDVRRYEKPWRSPSR